MVISNLPTGPPPPPLFPDNGRLCQSEQEEEIARPLCGRWLELSFCSSPAVSLWKVGAEELEVTPKIPMLVTEDPCPHEKTQDDSVDGRSDFPFPVHRPASGQSHPRGTPRAPVSPAHARSCETEEGLTLCQIRTETGAELSVFSPCFSERIRASVLGVFTDLRCSSFSRPLDPVSTRWCSPFSPRPLQRFPPLGRRPCMEAFLFFPPSIILFLAGTPIK